MKRLLFAVALLAPAVVLWPSGSPQASQGVSSHNMTQRVALQPVANPAACRAAVEARPTFTSLAAMHAFTTTGPCAIATSTNASANVRTMVCDVNLSGLLEQLGLLWDWVTDTWSLSCTGGVGTPTLYCQNLTIIPDGVPTVEPGIPAIGAGGCDSRSPIQETPAAVRAPAVQAGLVVGFDLAGDVGVAPAVGTFPT